MRLLGAILSSLMAVSPAAAEPAKQAEPKEQTKADTKEQPKARQAAAKPKKAEKKAADKNEKTEKVGKEILDSYAAIPLSDRVSIQSDLIWTGDYNGVLSGEFGERSVAAVKAFQKRKGGKETGVLNLQERAALSAAAKPKQEAVGWRIVDDLSTGARIGVPAKLMPTTNVGGGIRAANPSAHELCTIEIALARSSVGHVSATSVAPVFHSPPMPNPSRNRATANIAMLFASPDANEQSEYVRMLAINACLRPMRSARNPKNTPPIPDASKVSVPRDPAVVLLMPRSRISMASTREYSIASKASSAQPMAAASRVLRCAGVA